MQIPSPLPLTPSTYLQRGVVFAPVIRLSAILLSTLGDTPSVACLTVNTVLTNQLVRYVYGVVVSLRRPNRTNPSSVACMLYIYLLPLHICPSSCAKEKARAYNYILIKCIRFPSHSFLLHTANRWIIILTNWYNIEGNVINTNYSILRRRTR